MKIQLIEKDLKRIIEEFSQGYKPLNFNEPNNYAITSKGVDYEINELFHENGLTDFEIKMIG